MTANGYMPTKDTEPEHGILYYGVTACEDDRSYFEPISELSNMTHSASRNTPFLELSSTDIFSERQDKTQLPTVESSTMLESSLRDSNDAMQSSQIPDFTSNSSSNSNEIRLSAASIKSPGKIGRAKTPKRERKFVCKSEGCGKSFAKKWNLNAHERLHTGSKPFACRLGCGEHHMWMSSLKSHESRKCRLLPESLKLRRKPRTKKFDSVHSSTPNQMSKRELDARASETRELSNETSQRHIDKQIIETRSEDEIFIELENILAK